MRPFYRFGGLSDNERGQHEKDVKDKKDL